MGAGNIYDQGEWGRCSIMLTPPVIALKGFQYNTMTFAPNLHSVPLVGNSKNKTVNGNTTSGLRLETNR